MAERNVKATPSNTYVNAAERDVVIWASGTQGNDSLDIVSGMHTQGKMRVYEMLNCLDIIITKGDRVKPCPDSFALYPLDDKIDPTEFSVVSFFDYLRRKRVIKEDCLIYTSSDFIKPGHYVLFRIQTQNRRGGIEAFIPELEETIIQSRVPRTSTRKSTIWKVNPKPPRKISLIQRNPQRNVPSKKGKKNPKKLKETPTKQATYTRSKKLPVDVRERDMRCRVTGLNITRRHPVRGPNFKGFHVAHVVPLAHVEDVFDDCGLDEDTFQLVATHEAADRPVNALLMRADIHDLFDDYQFGYMPIKRLPEHPEEKSGQRFKLVIFEKSGAPVLADMLHSDIFAPGGGPNILADSDVDHRLLEFHFRVGLLWHFAGQGRTGAHHDA